MKQLILPVVFCLFLLCPQKNILGQADTGKPLVSGPMLGYVEHFEALIWLEVGRDVEEVCIVYWEGKAKRTTQTLCKKMDKDMPFRPVKMKLQGLKMNTLYNYSIEIDGKKRKVKYPLQFTTKKLWEWREDPPAFSILLGSCNYINDTEYDRPGTPYGKGTTVFKHMADADADLMLWLGDNIYLREVDWGSEYGIWYRNHHTRKTEDLQRFLATQPHHAIWDDHDYGPNNSNTSYEMREVALESFKQYWGNKTYGEVGNSGTYGKFTHVDAEFFLLDGRYHRAANRMDKDNPDKAYLGKRQMEWLKSGLLSSTSTFKFVASGSQVLNPLNDHECFRTYEKEHTELLEFIKKHKIKGVVFLSGDRHHSVITKVEEEGFYPLYDITSSPLSSGAYKPRGKEAENPYFVKNTLYGSQNYLKVSISGERKARGMIISCYDAHSNEKQWEYAIEANDLQVPKKK